MTQSIWSESVRWNEGYARVAEWAAALPETRVVYVADRAADLLALMVRARDLDHPNRTAATLEAAVERIDWYRARWEIERLFLVLKGGCRVETLQLNGMG